MKIKKIDTGGKLELWWIKGLFGEGELDYLVKSINTGARTSKVVGSGDNSKDQTVLNTGHRKSLSYTFEKHDNYINEFFDQKLHDIASEVIGEEIPIDRGEKPQGQKYEPGGYFKPHWDAFPPHGEANIHHIGSAGNRTYTLMVYLNDVEKGGDTCFTHLDLCFSPQRNTALMWANLTNLRDNNAISKFSMHEGTKVEEGEKFIITKWFRNGIPWKN